MTHSAAVIYLLHTARHPDAPSAAADAAALASNPHTSFEDFAAVVSQHLNQWVDPYHDPWEEPDYQVPVGAPGARAREWWTELALLDTSMAFGIAKQSWHLIWVLRRAVAVADPLGLARIYRRVSRDDYLNRTVLRVFIALLRLRAREPEPARLAAEPPALQGWPMDGWDDPWQRLRADVPDRTTRAQARQALAGMLAGPGAYPAPVATFGSVRLAVLSEYLVDGPRTVLDDVDVRFALLTPQDLCRLVRVSGRCLSHSELGWFRDIRWPSFGVRDTGARFALTMAPLDRELAEPHLRCPARPHRLALVLNPFTPDDVALAALTLGLEELEDALVSRARHSTHAYPLIERWWRAIMAVRGWFPAQTVQAGMQQVAACMLQAADPLGHWLRHLGVLASAPDGIKAMSRSQLALFDALMAERAARAPVKWPGRGPNGDPYAEIMSPTVLRQLVAATGWAASGLLADPAIVSVLDGLPLDLRVEAARRADDAVLQHLVRDPQPRVRQFAARNRRASATTLHTLLGDPDPSVRSQVARNAGVTAAHLTSMSRDDDRRVARASSRVLLNRLGAA